MLAVLPLIVLKKLGRLVVVSDVPLILKTYVCVNAQKSVL
jgi:hypothetical protein